MKVDIIFLNRTKRSQPRTRQTTFYIFFSFITKGNCILSDHNGYRYTLERFDQYEFKGLVAALANFFPAPFHRFILIRFTIMSLL